MSARGKGWRMKLQSQHWRCVNEITRESSSFADIYSRPYYSFVDRISDESAFKCFRKSCSNCAWEGFPSDGSEGEETLITIKTHFADDEVKILVKISTKAKTKLTNARFFHLPFLRQLESYEKWFSPLRRENLIYAECLRRDESKNKSYCSFKRKLVREHKRVS